MSTKTSGDWIAQFPGLMQLDEQVKAPLAESSRIVSLPVGTRIFGPGQAPSNYMLLLEGSVRVQQSSDTGREIVLYRVSAGETCALTTACLMGYEEYQAEAIAETNVSAVAVPRETFDSLMAKSPDFRRFVFAAFSERITNLLKVIEEVAFARIDIRLAQNLLRLAGDNRKAAVTHQQLASELGTAREVISRQLQEFQRRGWTASSRGAIEIMEREALEQLAKA
jgi:CRP/FNR family transcriptional regulator, anaerobic regulatory protein